VLVVVQDRMGVVGSIVDGILGSSLGGTVGDEFSGAVSVSALSGIRDGGVTTDAEKIGVDLVLAARVFLRDWCM